METALQHRGQGHLGGSPPQAQPPRVHPRIRPHGLARHPFEAVPSGSTVDAPTGSGPGPPFGPPFVCRPVRRLRPAGRRVSRHQGTIRSRLQARGTRRSHGMPGKRAQPRRPLAACNRAGRRLASDRASADLQHRSAGRAPTQRGGEVPILRSRRTRPPAAADANLSAASWSLRKRPGTAPRLVALRRSQTGRRRCRYSVVTRALTGAR